MTYPIVFLTLDRPDSLDFSISKGMKNKKTGASELVAFSHIFRLGLDEIQEDVSVCIQGHHYEPDLVYMNPEKGVYVDIEIDEPYSGRHKPTHCIQSNGWHTDTLRNQLFQRAGWIVVRFSEKQMFCQTKACMKYLYDLLLPLGMISSIPKSLLDSPDLQSEPCWSEDESRKLSYAHQRKDYLGYDPVRMDFSSYFRCCLLIIPILFQSLVSSRIRRMMIKQLVRFFVTKK